MKVIVAPDKFRGSLSASEAATAIALGIRRVRPAADLRLIPVADGGEGTVAALVAAGYEPDTVTVRGPLGPTVRATFARRYNTAVVELAQASGLHRLGRPPDAATARTASSFGTGQVIAAALAAGARRIVLGVGGSASTDGGAGLVQALGVRLLDGSGRSLAAGGAELLRLATIDPAGLDPRVADVEFVLATDVDNPLLGGHGAAHVYGAQKGADPATVAELDEALRRLADAVTVATGQDPRDVAGAGAAGGIGATVIPLLDARVRSGSALLLDLVGLPAAVEGAALVITGEGSLDAQSLRGKAPVGVARAAAAVGVPVVAVAGRVAVDDESLHAAGIRQAYSLTELEPDPDKSMARAAELLSRRSERIAEEWLD